MSAHRVFQALVFAVVVRPAEAAPTTPTSVPTVEAASALGGLDPALYQRARHAYDKALAHGDVRRHRLVVIDYTRASTQERLWVFDVDRDRLLFKELVAHGKNTGDNIARSFSNEPGSLKSSVGVFVTDTVYVGEHGKSLRLDGLEKGFNDRARGRAIVIHGADYVDAALGPTQGRIGRSWGCPALSPTAAPKVIDAIKDGALVFAWGSDTRWQQHSAYLN